MITSTEQLSPKHRNVLLKAVGIHMQSLRKRLTTWSGPSDGKDQLAEELDLLIEARNLLEEE